MKLLLALAGALGLTLAAAPSQAADLGYGPGYGGYHQYGYERAPHWQPRPYRWHHRHGYDRPDGYGYRRPHHGHPYEW